MILTNLTLEKKNYEQNGFVLYAILMCALTCWANSSLSMESVPKTKSLAGVNG